MLTEPEQALWMSVLAQAVRDLSGPDLVAKSARAWFDSGDNAVGSFRWVCHHLSLDPDAVRQTWRREIAMRPSPDTQTAAANPK